jgi:putative colanic acid biosysnthesis UDP-glucose lipid carrier transferase
MPGNYAKYIKLICSVGDLFFLNISAVAGYYLRFKTNENFYDAQYLSLLLYSNLAWLTAASLLNSYNVQRTSRLTNIASANLKQIILFILLVEATLNITKSYFFSRTFLTYSYVILTVTIFIWRVSLTFLLRLHRSKGGNYKKVVIVGFNKASNQLRRYFENNPENGYRFLGFFDEQVKNNKVIGTFEEIKSFVLNQRVDEIYCSAYNLTSSQVTHLIDFAEDNLVRLKFIPESNLIQSRKFKVDFYDLLPVIVLRPIPLDDLVNQGIKRVFDIVFSLLVIVFILSWLIPIIAILVKLDSPGPVFFKQSRNGRGNKMFYCFKFRSMRVNEESDTLQATKFDSRVTRLGSFLRRSSIDELPQFFNILLGDMSVVGPRPHPIQLNENYRRLIERYMSRHLIKPGITGLAQVMGYRGETSKAHQMKGRIKMDVFYLENWTFLLDIKIIFLTIWNVFKGEDNAY